jgi:hypothetical protein
MPSAPTTPQRQRMIKEMSIRQFGKKTQRDYVRVVTREVAEIGIFETCVEMRCMSWKMARS